MALLERDISVVRATELEDVQINVNWFYIDYPSNTGTQTYFVGAGVSFFRLEINTGNVPFSGTVKVEFTLNFTFRNVNYSIAAGESNQFLP